MAEQLKSNLDNPPSPISTDASETLISLLMSPQTNYRFGKPMQISPTPHTEKRPSGSEKCDYFEALRSPFRLMPPKGQQPKLVKYCKDTVHKFKATHTETNPSVSGEHDYFEAPHHPPICNVPISPVRFPHTRATNNSPPEQNAATLPCVWTSTPIINMGGQQGTAERSLMYGYANHHYTMPPPPVPHGVFLSPYSSSRWPMKVGDERQNVSAPGSIMKPGNHAPNINMSTVDPVRAVLRGSLYTDMKQDDLNPDYYPNLRALMTMMDDSLEQNETPSRQELPPARVKAGVLIDSTSSMEEANNRGECSSSSDGALNSSNMFDEDLEPMDLSKRTCFPDNCNTQKPSESESNSSRNAIPTSQGKQQGFSKYVISQQGIFKRESDVENISQNLQFSNSGDSLNNDSTCTKENRYSSMDLPLKKRHRHKNSSAGTKAKAKVKERLGGHPSKKKKKDLNKDKFCQQCSSDYRATSLVGCPVCPTQNVIHNCLATTNSLFSPLMSLPFQISLLRKDDSITAIANCVIKSHTLMGPMDGEEISIKDIHKETDLRYIWLTDDTTTEETVVLSTLNESKSNWLRYVKAGKDLTSYNLALVHQKKKIFFITMQKVNAGQELVLRPLDPMIVKFNRKQETKCSLCNLTCSSPLYLAKHRLFFHPFLQENLSSNVPTKTHTHSNEHTHSSEHTQSSEQKQVHNITLPNHGSCPRGLNVKAVETKENVEDSSPLTWFCTECRSHFKSKSGYRAHMSIVHKHQSPNQVIFASYNCPDCHATFRSQWSLYRHTKCHQMAASGCKLLACPECGREFWRKQSYRRHVQAHQANNIQQAPTCDHCGRRFYSSSNLKVHLLTHSGVKPFTCTECGAGFTTKQSLQFHYIKKHGYFYGTLPDIARKVPFTFQDYGGSSESNMKPDEGYAINDELGNISPENGPENKEAVEQNAENESKQVPCIESDSGIVLDSSVN